MPSPLFFVLHSSPLFPVDFVVAWWLTVGNELGFAPILIWQNFHGLKKDRLLNDAHKAMGLMGFD